MPEGYAFSHDPERCIKCYTCEIACDVHRAHAGEGGGMAQGGTRGNHQASPSIAANSLDASSAVIFLSATILRIAMRSESPMGSAGGLGGWGAEGGVQTKSIFLP